jgi:GNAT superfamily N-acetyltransferase
MAGRAESIQIVPAQPSDCESIAVVHYCSFIKTYTGCTPEITERAIEEHLGPDEVRVPRKADWLGKRLAEPDRTVYVARLGGVAVGYLDGAPHKIDGFYIDPPYQGRGIGRRALHHYLGHRQEKGDVFLDVVPNTPAVKFYEAQGFEATGKSYSYPWHSDSDSDVKLPLIEMVLPDGRLRDA